MTDRPNPSPRSASATSREGGEAGRPTNERKQRGRVAVKLGAVVLGVAVLFAGVNAVDKAMTPESPSTHAEKVFLESLAHGEPAQAEHSVLVVDGSVRVRKTPGVDNGDGGVNPISHDSKNLERVVGKGERLVIIDPIPVGDTGWLAFTVDGATAKPGETAGNVYYVNRRHNPDDVQTITYPSAKGDSELFDARLLPDGTFVGDATNDQVAVGRYMDVTQANFLVDALKAADVGQGNPGE